MGSNWFLFFLFFFFFLLQGAFSCADGWLAQPSLLLSFILYIRLLSGTTLSCFYFLHLLQASKLQGSGEVAGFREAAHSLLSTSSASRLPLLVEVSLCTEVPACAWSLWNRCEGWPGECIFLRPQDHASLCTSLGARHSPPPPPPTNKQTNTKNVLSSQWQRFILLFVFREFHSH